GEAAYIATGLRHCASMSRHGGRSVHFFERAKRAPETRPRPTAGSGSESLGFTSSLEITDARRALGCQPFFEPPPAIPHPIVRNEDHDSSSGSSDATSPVRNTVP